MAKVLKNIKSSMPENVIRVLVVEDHNLSAHIAERFLTELGCQVECVMDGKTALERFNNENNVYHLVLMDVSLPDVDGCLLAEKIRQTAVFQALLKEGPLPIIALTARDGEQNKQRCLAAGMTSVLIKPLLKTTAKDILKAYVPAWGATQFEAESIPTQSVRIAGEPINFEYALNIHDGDVSFIKSALQMVLDNLVVELKQLQAECLLEHWDVSRVIIHKLEGGTRYFGLVRLDQVCAHFSEILKKNPTHHWQAWYNVLVSEVEKVNQAYATWIERSSIA